MKKYCCLILLTALSFTLASAQIVNVESLRRVSDSAKWSGSAGLDIDLIKNTKSIFKITNKLRLQYNNGKNLYLFMNDLKLEQIESSSFVNKGTQHFRYNRRISERLKLEAFAQTQYDAISDIKFRGLVGVGPRLKLSKNDNYRYYLGTLLMYEHEESSDRSIDILRDFRGSAYFSFSLFPLNNLSIVSTTYYQPLLKQFSDFRVANETSVAFKIIEDLLFKTTFTYNFDASPIVGIPKTQYELSNGIVYTFN
ncbi:uncharacterized protein DUF481 [Winogradskyella epiphytica]|uniref:Uncharacterized protein DUF481 n=1 Tax=Winogradskyella epiphytica TaxID=262005 RepID=A0A2V4XDH8_9FLAO|nr:DUF481 domain-containing protein [Winogradskyella epiphytica]PYE80454.1 uncharacterized protein DUF481 [Winogradskyella epiphytica]GGW69353.1 hypothetical protein GCM10008085_21620 [Winogradskyella epiphytica]